MSKAIAFQLPTRSPIEGEGFQMPAASEGSDGDVIPNIAFAETRFAAEAAHPISVA